MAGSITWCSDQTHLCTPPNCEGGDGGFGRESPSRARTTAFRLEEELPNEMTDGTKTAAKNSNAA
ncbi:hypothetical protein CV102_09030 [Natronococcus pandeyae]|uniref:Uncharacterized protein n=1 Tax=Natronococcus pandeyae TaxID=2055836 RepID=A0A8J8Q4I4_9EURY|nr:hypothetical protein CV102_09030 [Natronococcus pandeyae]